MKVYAKSAGARVTIAGYGEASATHPVEVPAAVAAELANHPALRVEVPETGEGKEAPSKGKEKK